MMPTVLTMPGKVTFLPREAGRGFCAGRRVPEALGPMPEATLACFIDLGLTDAEIAHYFGLPREYVTALTQMIRARIESDPCR
ncbi:MAG: hypothetical protein GC186_16670 [Rhodobacteraceae bacterium]|nr:hypothetical protein [Paracoccaceae bacterium]